MTLLEHLLELRTRMTWIAGAVILTNLIVDVSYGFLDPRIRVAS